MDDVATPSASREAAHSMLAPDFGVWPCGLARVWLRGLARPLDPRAPAGSSEFPAAQREALRIVVHDKERR
ncbi:MAG: hypothetical protein ACJ8GJ_19880, partial [Vitreoscilla sp.]